MIKLGKIELGRAPAVAGVIVGPFNAAKLKRAARDGSDLLELRLDTLRRPDPGPILKTLKSFREVCGIPLILTIRSKAEGGRYAIKDPERLRLFEKLMPVIDGVDIELGSGKILKGVIKSARRAGKKVIVSYHNFTTTPRTASLRKTIARARQKGADIVKLAVPARKPSDLKPLAGLLLDSGDLIVIAMGRCGAPSRVLFPLLGSLITYGSVNGKSAPGQMPVKTIKAQLLALGFK